MLRRRTSPPSLCQLRHAMPSPNEPKLWSEEFAELANKMKLSEMLVWYVRLHDFALVEGSHSFWDTGSKLWEANCIGGIKGKQIVMLNRRGLVSSDIVKMTCFHGFLKAFTFEPEPDMIVSWNLRVLESKKAGGWIQGRSPKSLKYDWMLGDQSETKCNKARHLF